jgi:hypothetical protein
LPNIIRGSNQREMLIWVEHVAYMKEVRNVFTILVGKFHRRRLLGRLSCRSEDNIKMELT